MNPDTPSLLPNETAIEPTALPPRPSLIHRTFLGADGLRAGWGLLIFVLLLAGVLFGVRVIAQKIHPPTGHHAPEMSWPVMLVNEGIPFLAIALITWIMSKIERRPISVFGLGGTRKAPLFFAGLGWGFACLTLLFVILWRGGLLVIDQRLLHGSDVVRYGAIWLINFLFVGLLEEYLTRGYMQYTLTRGLAGFFRKAFKTQHSEAFGFWTTAIIFSILFGLGHSGNPGESPLGVACAGAAGFLFCFSLWRTGSLWWAVGFHTSWDWSQSYLYGVADSGMMVQHHLLATHPVGKPILSGGTTGPEGSAWVILVMLIAAVIIAVTLPRRKGYLAGSEARVAG